MKILIIIKKWKGGVGNSSRRTKKALEKRGHKIKIISREDDLKKFSLLSSIFSIRKYVKEHAQNFDIIYTKDWSMALPLLFPYPLFLRKHFCDICGVERKKSRIFQIIVTEFMGIFGRLTVSSDYLKGYFPKSKVIYRGIDDDEFKPLNKERKYIGWVKKETEEINEDFVKKLSKKTKFPYIIAEDTPYNKMNDFYNKCLIFISFPPKESGGNNVWAEAMSAGVPMVIGNERTLTKDWPIEKIKNHEDEFEKLTRLVKNYKYYKKDHRKWLKEKGLTWDNTAKKILKVFKERKNKKLCSFIWKNF